jgi:8-oxo-dGTP pyrophosphatase MutT (NUDIX family)
VADYLSSYSQDAEALAVLTAALRLDCDLTSRKTFTGHATASAVVLGEDDRVLMVHHRAMDRWLCPGGHLEVDDDDFAEAALREVAEEAGISSDVLVLVSARPVHIDAHPIPANDAKGEPDHVHFDFRMLFRLTGQTELTLQGQEVKGAAWRDVAEIPDQALRERIAESLGTLDDPTSDVG